MRHSNAFKAYIGLYVKLVETDDEHEIDLLLDSMDAAWSEILSEELVKVSEFIHDVKLSHLDKWEGIVPEVDIYIYAKSLDIEDDDID